MDQPRIELGPPTCEAGMLPLSLPTRAVVTAGLEPATRALEERRSRPSELRHTKAAEPGFGPGISRFKAEHVSNYTTPQKS